jgi:hypothetical protein
VRSITAFIAKNLRGEGVAGTGGAADANGSARQRAEAWRGSVPIPKKLAQGGPGARLVVITVEGGSSEGRDTLHEWVVGGTTLRLIYLSRRPVTVVLPARLRNPRRLG